MTARYLLFPGPVTSQADGQRHQVSAVTLAALYGVCMSECLVFPMGRSADDAQRRNDLHERVARGELTALHPRMGGKYPRPEPGTGVQTGGLR